MVSALAALLALFSATAVAQGPPQIDGVISPGEWDGAEAIPMYLAGKPNNPQYATAHRLCIDDVEYWWVDGAPSCIDCGHDQFVKMKLDVKRAKTIKICDNAGVGSYVDIPGLDGNGLGWECSGAATGGCGESYGVIVHLSRWDGADWQSIRTAKKASVQ
jgi:hypothetical protein